MSSVPFGSFGFKVTLSDDTKTLGCFQEVSGLSISIGVEDYAEGGRNNMTHKLITGTSYSNLVFKRGLCTSSMYQLIDSVRNGVVKRLNGKVELLGDDGKTVVKTFSFKNGIPVKWDGPSLSVSGDAIATESLEIAHEGLTVG